MMSNRTNPDAAAGLPENFTLTQNTNNSLEIVAESNEPSRVVF